MCEPPTQLLTRSSCRLVRGKAPSSQAHVASRRLTLARLFLTGQLQAEASVGLGTLAHAFGQAPQQRSSPDLDPLEA